MPAKHSNTVVTWQAPNGQTLDVCAYCQDALIGSAGEWPRCSTGEQFCTVSHGRHQGTCEMVGDRAIATPADRRATAITEAVRTWTAGPDDGPEAGAARLVVRDAIEAARQAGDKRAEVRAAVIAGIDTERADRVAVLEGLGLEGGE